MSSVFKIFPNLIFPLVSSLLVFSGASLFYQYAILVIGAKGDWDFQISDLIGNPVGTDIWPLS